MINARELRLENCVQHGLDTVLLDRICNGGWARVKYRTTKGNFVTYDVEYNDLSPIELTPEILKSAGFVGWKRQVSMNMGYEGGDIFFGIPDGYDTFRGGSVKQQKYKHSFILDLVLGKKINDEDYQFTIYYGRGGSKKGLQLDYVHDLQNLYYALHKEELPINLQTITKCHTPKTEKKLLVKKITKSNT